MASARIGRNPELFARARAELLKQKPASGNETSSERTAELIFEVCNEVSARRLASGQ